MKITGSTEYCFSHFVDEFITEEDKGRILQDMVTYIGLTNVLTARKWFEARNFPIGINLVKLRYYLKSKGYNVEELQKLQVEVYTLGDLIASKKTSFEEALHFLYDGEPSVGQRDTLLAILRGVQICSRKMLRRIKSFNIQLDYDSAHLKQHVGVRVAASVEEESSCRTEKFVSPQGDFLLLLLDPMTAVIEHLLSDETPKSVRQQLRDNAGKRIFKLSNLVSKLCSETARNTEEV